VRYKEMHEKMYRDSRHRTTETMTLSSQFTDEPLEAITPALAGVFF
jgi:hypothetical protein